ncbi:MAG: hypothetical protein BWY83_02455 [bacterium ADurb.Bin478]|nr:MAG: hypothetical protein BWY83_02455 [bacterium ADurb.Bin478]
MIIANSRLIVLQLFMDGCPQRVIVRVRMMLQSQIDRLQRHRCVARRQISAGEIPVGGEIVRPQTHRRFIGDNGRIQPAQTKKSHSQVIMQHRIITGQRQGLMKVLNRRKVSAALQFRDASLIQIAGGGGKELFNLPLLLPGGRRTRRQRTEKQQANGCPAPPWPAGRLRSRCHR